MGQEDALTVDDTEVVFTADQVSAASTALRTALALPPEHFTATQFMGMIADEIGRLRAAGWSDGEIEALINESTGSTLPEGSVKRHEATPAHQ